MSRFQPRLKTTATTSTTTPTQDLSLLSPTPPIPQSAQSLQPPQNVHPSYLTDASTFSLVRRTLCSNTLSDKARNTPIPIDSILPPLTSSNEVDLQVYAFIAIIVKEYVYSWYGKITPDQTFVEETLTVTAHCTRGLEQRIRKIDLESLLGDELPDVLYTHLRAYRTAHSPLNPPPSQPSPRQVYHLLWPTPALSPVPDDEDPAILEEQMQNEAAYRQLLVQGVLALLLPTEDLENDCLTALVGQIFSELILGGGIGGKASEPWMIWEGIMKAAEVVQKQLPTSEAEKNVGNVDATIPATQPTLRRYARAGNRVQQIGDSIQKWTFIGLQMISFALSLLRFTMVTIATSSSLPTRYAHATKGTATATNKLSNGSVKRRDATSSDTINPPTSKVPILELRIWTCASDVLDLDFRIPWLKSMISMLQWLLITGPGALGNTNGMLDRFLSHQIHTHILNPTLLPPLLRTLRSVLFPNNRPAAPRTVPSAAEQLLIRRRCAETLLNTIPDFVSDIYFFSSRERYSRLTGSAMLGGVRDDQSKAEERQRRREEKLRQIEEEWLDVFSDAYCNRHLMYGLVEVVLVRIFPELVDKVPSELLSERLG